jgi:glycosyltransferase involved in cell wall biosynthesis
VDPQPIAIIAGQLVLGGAERQLYLWLSHLDRGRFSPVVVTLHPGHGDYWEPEVTRLGIPLLRIPRGGSRLNRLREVVRVLRPHRPRLIHGWHLFASVYAGAAAKLLGARALGSLRGSYRAYRAQRVEALLSGLLTDALVVNSFAAATLVARNGGLPRRIFVLPNAVENVAEERESAREQVAQRWGIPRDRVWIGSVGRFQKSKRFDQLLNVAARLAIAGHSIHVLLIGYGEGENELRGLAKRLGIAGSVTFTGEDPLVRFWMSALDVFCFPSEDEGLPNAVLEAAAAGVPVAAWRTPFLEEALNGTAALADSGDLRNLEETVGLLLRNPAARRELGDRARGHVVDKFGVARFVTGLTAIYEQLMARA